MDNSKNKLEALKKDIDNYQDKKKSKSNSSKKNGAGFAFKISTEILAALIVGVVIGLIVDNYFNSQPFGLIIFFFLGAFAGFFNVYRVMRRIVKK